MEQNSAQDIFKWINKEMYLFYIPASVPSLNSSAYSLLPPVITSLNPPLFLFRKWEVSHGYENKMAYQVSRTLSTSLLQEAFLCPGPILQQIMNLSFQGLVLIIIVWLVAQTYF